MSTDEAREKARRWAQGLGLPKHDEDRLADELAKGLGQRCSLSLRCKGLADKYIEASNVLDAHMTASTNANMAPALITCRAFALELLFKALVLIDRDDIFDLMQLSEAERKRFATHKLSELFDQVPDRYKQRLSDIYSARQSVPRLPVDRFRTELLEKANSTFTEWRYVHERELEEPRTLDLALISNLIVAVQLLGAEVKGSP